MSNIEWTDDTWNPVSGCTRASAGCDNCYAVRMSYRLETMGQTKYAGLTSLNLKGDRHFNGVVKTHADDLAKPLGWSRPRRIFVNSMSDTFHKDVPTDFIDAMYAVMALAQRHTFQVLTKRPERMAQYLNDPQTWQRINRAAYEWANSNPDFRDRREENQALKLLDAWKRSTWPLSHVWHGTSAEDQPAADLRLPFLLRCPGLLYVSVEPMIGPVSFAKWIGQDTWPAHPLIGCPEYQEVGEEAACEGCPCGGPDCPGEWQRPLAWVICGGESGKGARPFDPQDAYSLMKECEDAGVAFFFKQMGSKPFDKFNDVAVKIKDPKGHDWEGANYDALRVQQWPKVLA